MFELTLKLLRNQIKDRIRVHLEIEKDLYVWGNASQLGQVWVNLVSNAAQAIAHKGDIWIHAERINEDYAEIHIRDNGQGISPELQDKIFDPFFTTKKVGVGTGLGLSIVYGILERHEGKIFLNSSTDSQKHGTTFVIRLPTQQIKSQKPPTPQSA